MRARTAASTCYDGLLTKKKKRRLQQIVYRQSIIITRPSLFKTQMKYTEYKGVFKYSFFWPDPPRIPTSKQNKTPALISCQYPFSQRVSQLPIIYTIIPERPQRQARGPDLTARDKQRSTAARLCRQPLSLPLPRLPPQDIPLPPVLDCPTNRITTITFFSKSRKKREKRGEVKYNNQPRIRLSPYIHTSIRSRRRK